MTILNYLSKVKPQNFSNQASNNWISPRLVPALGNVMGGIFIVLGGVFFLAIAVSRWRAKAILKKNFKFQVVLHVSFSPLAFAVESNPKSDHECSFKEEKESHNKE